MGLDRLFFEFFSIDLHLPQALHSWQVLASLAERYSLGLFGMRSFVAPLHKMVTRCLKNPQARYHTSSASKFAVGMWRVISFIAFVDPSFVTVPLWSFTDKSVIFRPSFIIISTHNLRLQDCRIWEDDISSCFPQSYQSNYNQPAR